MGCGSALCEVAGHHAQAVDNREREYSLRKENKDRAELEGNMRSKCGKGVKPTIGEKEF